MNVLSHERTRRLLHTPVEDLSAVRQADLADHLAGCLECQAYARDLRALQQALARGMHIRWDTWRPSAASSHTIQQRWEQGRLKRQGVKFIAVLAGISTVVLLILYSPALLSSLLPLLNINPVAPWVTKVPLPAIPTATKPLPAPTPTLLHDTPITCGNLTEPLCSVEQAEALSGFDIYAPIRLPDGLTFDGAIAEPGKSSTLVYFCGDGCQLTIYQQKRTCTENQPCNDEFSRERRGELVILGAYVGYYYAGASGAESGTVIPTGVAAAATQVLQWPSGDQTSEFGFRISQTGSTTAANRLDRVGLIELAENLLGIPSAYGLIAFETNRDGNAEIYVRKYRSEQATNLTNNKAADHSFTWSLDGERMAFLSDRTGALEVFVMMADGSNVVQLTHASGVSWNGTPAWSPDGAHLALTGATSASGEEASLIYLVATDGSGFSLLSEEPVYTNQPLQWLPDGKWIAYTENSSGGSAGNQVSSNSGLKAIALDGGMRIILSGQENKIVGSFDWSPDGQKLAFTWMETSRDSLNLTLANADGLDSQIVYTEGIGGSLTLGDLAWSPDGNKIAYTILVESADATPNLWANVFLYDFQANELTANASFPAFGLSRISWSPLGLQILYAMDSIEPPAHWIAATMLGENLRPRESLSIIGNTVLEESEVGANDNTNPQWQPRP